MELMRKLYSQVKRDTEKSIASGDSLRELNYLGYFCILFGLALGFSLFNLIIATVEEAGFAMIMAATLTGGLVISAMILTPFPYYTMSTP